MCNGTWVCFECRLTKRRPTWLASTATKLVVLGARADAVRCGRCRGPCCYLGPSVPVPRKDDVVAWKRLRERLGQHRSAVLGKSFMQSVRRRHDLEQRLRDLKARPKSRGRDVLIKQLEKELALKR